VAKRRLKPRSPEAKRLGAVRVRFSEASIERSNSGAILGDLWLEVGDAAFPAENWSDFIVVILTWWLEALDGLRRPGAKEDLRFMDGPYRALARVRSGHRVRVDCLEERLTATRVACTGEIDRTELERQVVDVARSVARFCRRKRWASRDLELLESLIAGTAD
jgi:hypothetical protein